MTSEQNSPNLISPQKFLFDTDFTIDAPVAKVVAPEPVVDIEVEPEFVEEIAPTFSEAQLDQAREEGRQAGRDAAIADMTSALEQQVANTLSTINTQVEQAFQGLSADADANKKNAITIATVIMRKLFPSLNAQHSLVEIENLITESLQRTSSAPSLLIKVPENIFQDLEPKIKEMAALRGREDKISISADIDMAAGDLQVEWDGGGILRDTTLMWEQIDGIVERNLGTQLPVQKRTAEQEVVKQAAVSENGSVAVESSPVQETPHEAPSLDDAQPDEKEPVD